ncbi:MAG: tRNA methyltransferase, partial [Rhodospirillaceae bacterium]|nr:tRNA methyltransferase [Rhodospirillaceae bacterium]
MRMVLYQPDIPQNAGAILRLGACMGVAVDIVEPCGFALSDARMRRAGMDYLDRAALTRHASWDAYLAARGGGRLILLTTTGATPPAAFRFTLEDNLLLG